MMINKTPGVMGGVACIGDTRIAVWQIIQQAKTSDVLADYPSLTASDVMDCINYYYSNPTEIEQDIRDNEDTNQ